MQNKLVIKPTTLKAWRAEIVDDTGSRIAVIHLLPNHARDDTPSGGDPSETTKPHQQDAFCYVPEDQEDVEAFYSHMSESAHTQMIDFTTDGENLDGQLELTLDEADDGLPVCL